MIRSACSDEVLAAIRAEGLDSVEGAFAYSGGRDMTVPGLGHRGRMHVRLTSPGGSVRDLFLKRYRREPLAWRLRRRWTYGPGKTPAGVEFENIRLANAASLPTIRQALCGEEFDRWGARRSFIIVSAVPGEALEQSAEGFCLRHADRPDVMEDFTRRLASLVGAFHGAGFAHRDLYSSHVFLHERNGGVELHLIDLARMFRPRWRRFRWFVKDLAALNYSMPLRWVAPCWDLFLREYLARGVAHDGAGDEARFARVRRAVAAKVAYMRWRISR